MSDRIHGETSDVKYKVLLLGDTLVGKTSIQRSISGKDFRTNTGPTIGMTNFVQLLS
jgi:GTPase SAR1 family protein